MLHIRKRFIIQQFCVVVVRGGSVVSGSPVAKRHTAWAAQLEELSSLEKLQLCGLDDLPGFPPLHCMPHLQVRACEGAAGLLHCFLLCSSGLQPDRRPK